MFDYDGVEFRWTGHDGFRIVAGNIIIYIDPFKLTPPNQNKNDADILLISHNHFDHLSPDDIKQVINENTTIVAAKECLSSLESVKVKEVRGVKPGDKLTVSGVPIEAVAAYNTNKQFHPKEDQKVGFVFTVNNTRVYHTGDTDEISEMNDINPDIALVPVSGTYVMNAKEAADAVNQKIRPRRLAIPMHYNSIVGTESDAMDFKDQVQVCKVEILQRE